MAAPIRKADNFWEYTVRLIDNSYTSVLDATSCQIGMDTRFITNYKTEYHSEGFTKFQSNIERHRNWITEHRVDLNYSARYAALEDVFVKVSKNENGGDYKEAIFKMSGGNKLLLDNFMEAKNNGMLLQKGTMDANGKSTIIDAQGRPVIAGDGAIPQLNRFAGMYNYAKLSVAVFNKAMTTLAQKAEKPQGNTFMFICNELCYAQVQIVLAEYLNQFKIIAPVIYSQSAKGEVEVGTEYVGYNFLGNKVLFKVDRALSREYPTKGYAILVDVTSDAANGGSPIQMFTLEGCEFTHNTISGVGGLDGKTSGSVSSPVAGSKMVNSGYAGIGVFTPYRSYIMLEA
jgi:hypothetical protein